MKFLKKVEKKLNIFLKGVYLIRIIDICIDGICFIFLFFSLFFFFFFLLVVGLGEIPIFDLAKQHFSPVNYRPEVDFRGESGWVVSGREKLWRNFFSMVLAGWFGIRVLGNLGFCREFE